MRLRAFTDKSLCLTIHSLKKTLLAISTLSSIRFHSLCLCVSAYTADTDWKHFETFRVHNVNMHYAICSVYCTHNLQRSQRQRWLIPYSEQILFTHCRRSTSNIVKPYSLCKQMQFYDKTVKPLRLHFEMSQLCYKRLDESLAPGTHMARFSGYTPAASVPAGTVQM